ncbi:MAG TPA: 2-dehydropantoate 2-reductase [Alphaproteobacteria bacterium]|nr:2-dehydropantoate 2-reductase [Alphaproteobacteria bacterium]
MKIAVIGAGGVGGYFGGRLAEAGHDVWFVARGRHLQEMKRCGLKVKSRLGDMLIKPVQATEDPAEIGPVDFVIIAVKLWDTDAAIAAAKSLLRADTIVVSLQNGIEAVDRLVSAFGRQRVLGGVCHIAAVISGPGIILHTGTMARMTMGELDGGSSARLDAVTATCKDAKIDFVATPEIDKAIWHKFVFLSSFAGVTTLTRLPKGPILAEAETRALLKAAIAEAVAVARARGVKLADDLPDQLIKFAEGLPDDMKSSMLGDLERGARLELPWLSGTVAQLGASLGVATPVHKVIYQALKPYAEGRVNAKVPV